MNLIKNMQKICHLKTMVKKMDKFLSNFFGGVDNFVNKIGSIVNRAYKSFLKLFKKTKK